MKVTTCRKGKKVKGSKERKGEDEGRKQKDEKGTEQNEIFYR